MVMILLQLIKYRTILAQSETRACRSLQGAGETHGIEPLGQRVISSPPVWCVCDQLAEVLRSRVGAAQAPEMS